jgi:ketosteroid isomerase-like protein
MTETESDNIIKNVKDSYTKITEYSKNAQLDSFLGCYDNSPNFLSIGADGKMSNYEEFKKACTEYYNSLKEQSIITTQEKFHVLDKNLVIVGWTGNIIANLKNGDTVKMNNYSITSLFKMVEGKWKVIHDHESALPPEIIKNE